jgi:hypothetical protein
VRVALLVEHACEGERLGLGLLRNSSLITWQVLPKLNLRKCLQIHHIQAASPGYLSRGVSLVPAFPQNVLDHREAACSMKSSQDQGAFVPPPELVLGLACILGSS